jgi:hypothetical protein
VKLIKFYIKNGHSRDEMILALANSNYPVYCGNDEDGNGHFVCVEVEEDEVEDAN